MATKLELYEEVVKLLNDNKDMFVKLCTHEQIRESVSYAKKIVKEGIEELSQKKTKATTEVKE